MSQLRRCRNHFLRMYGAKKINPLSMVADWDNYDYHTIFDDRDVREHGPIGYKELSGRWLVKLISERATTDFREIQVRYPDKQFIIDAIGMSVKTVDELRSIEITPRILAGIARNTIIDIDALMEIPGESVQIHPDTYHRAYLEWNDPARIARFVKPSMEMKRVMSMETFVAHVLDDLPHGTLVNLNLIRDITVDEIMRLNGRITWTHFTGVRKGLTIAGLRRLGIDTCLKCLCDDTIENIMADNGWDLTLVMNKFLRLDDIIDHMPTNVRRDIVKFISTFRPITAQQIDRIADRLSFTDDERASAHFYDQVALPFEFPITSAIKNEHHDTRVIANNYHVLALRVAREYCDVWQHHCETPGGFRYHMGAP